MEFMKEVVEILEFLTEIPGTWGAVVMFSDLSFLTLWGFREDPTKFGLSYLLITQCTSTTLDIVLFYFTSKCLMLISVT